MGSVLAAGKILEAILHGLKKCEGWGGYVTPPAASMMGLKKVYNSYVLETVLVDGTIFLKANLHGVKKKNVPLQHNVRSNYTWTPTKCSYHLVTHHFFGPELKRIAASAFEGSARAGPGVGRCCRLWHNRPTRRWVTA